MQFTRVKYKGGKVHLEWIIEREGGGEPDEYLLKCGDTPTPEFKAAWEALASAIVREAELPVEMAATITPIGLSVSYYADDRWGACMSGLRALNHSNAPLVINTPHKPAEPTEGNPDDACVLWESSIRAISDVLSRAKEYVEGERAQQPLFEPVGATTS